MSIQLGLGGVAEVETGENGKHRCLCKLGLPSLRQKWASVCELRQRLQDILLKGAGKTKETLQSSEIRVADARLLNELARHMKIFAVVELCEIAVPLLYMMPGRKLRIVVFCFLILTAWFWVASCRLELDESK